MDLDTTLRLVGRSENLIAGDISGGMVNDDSKSRESSERCYCRSVGRTVGGVERCMLPVVVEWRQ